MHFPSDRFCSLLAGFLVMASLLRGVAQEAAPAAEGDTIHVPPKIEWEKIAELADTDGKKLGGYAGMFAGAHGDVLILAGGTDFPGAMPWEGGTRAFSDAVHVLERTVGDDRMPRYAWVESGVKLSEAMGCGASVSLKDGLLCVGGATDAGVRDGCFLLSWNAGERKVGQTEFPKLPQPLAWASAALVKNTVYVLGGTGELPRSRAVNSFYALDLSKRDAGGAAFAWKALPPWDGPPRMLAVAAASMEGGSEYLYLCGGRNPGGEPDFLTDLHRYNPVRKDWALLGDIIDPRGHPCAIVGAPAFHVPPHHLVIVSGTDETLTQVMESQARDLKEIDDAEKNRRRDYNRLLMEKFPGYTRTVLGYDAGIGEWNHLGHFPGTPCLTNPAVNWDGQIVIPGGETGPGRRSPEIWMGTIRKKPAAVIEEEEEASAEAPSGQRELENRAAGRGSEAAPSGGTGATAPGSAGKKEAVVPPRKP